MSQQGFFVRQISHRDKEGTIGNLLSDLLCFEKELNTDAITMFYHHQQKQRFFKSRGDFLEALQFGILTTFDTPDWLFLLDPTERQQTEKNQ